MNRLLRCLIPALLSGLLLAACSDSDKTASVPDTAGWEMARAANTRGVALMGRFDYAGAVGAFHDAVKARPDWVLARQNLAIATLNRQEPTDSQAAAELAQAIVTEAPDNLTARYILGILSFNEGQVEAASQHFGAVTQADPDDPYGWYFLGQSLFQLGELEPARAAYEKAVELDPYLRSAYYGAFIANQRLREPEAARTFLTEYQKLESNPRSRLAEIKYTKMGSKAMVQVDQQPVRANAQRPQLNGELFASPQPVPSFSDVTALTVAQFGPGDTRAFAMGDGDGAWQVGQNERAVSRPAFLSTAKAVSWGDIDNDGDVDAASLDSAGSLSLWLQHDSGFSAVEGFPATGQGFSDVLLVDADHDGDLDILLAGDNAHHQVIYNLRNGSYQIEIIKEGASISGGTLVMPADLDGDDDLDLIWLGAQAGPRVYLNDRLWDYTPVPSVPELDVGADAPVVAGDLDADGNADLLGRDFAGQLARWESGHSGWEKTAGGVNLGNADQLVLQDFDGNGVADLLISEPGGWRIISAGGFGALLYESDSRYLASINTVRGPEVLVEQEEGVYRLPAGSGRHGFVLLELSGMQDEGASMRSNASALGTRVALRSADQWVVNWHLRNHSGPGSTLQPVAIGLNGVEQADFVALDWPDGVYQTELDLAAGQVHRIDETQRQLASCPVLFAWDGQKHAFVSDVLGVGGIGFAVGRNTYAVPRPWERFQLPDELLRPLDGRYVIKITEPMEESAYIDQVALTAYDLPPGTQMVLDERLGTGLPEPTGALVPFSTMLRPQAATDQAGRSVLDELLEVDRVAVDPGEPDRRFAGLMKAPAELVITFEQDLGSLEAPVLYFDGWVEYGYSQTYFAAWQAGLKGESVSLDIRTPEGWQSWLPAWGYPAGMPRSGSLPLGALPAGTHSLRLTTNQEIYWDQLAIVEAASAESIRSHPLALSDARVSKTGFPVRTDLPQRVPTYNYSQREPFWDTEYHEGLYTALGPAVPLVEGHDNNLAIIGAGDELELQFDAKLPPLPAGWTRTFVVDLKGWAKDMDLYTRDGRTLGPLPVDPEAPSGSRALEERFNTRFQVGR